MLRDGASHSAIAFAMGAGLFAQLFGSIPVGVIVDRIGRLRTVRISVLLIAGSVFGMTFVHGALLNGALMAVRGFAFMSYVTGEFAYVAEVVPAERSVTAVSTLGLIANLEFAAAPAIGVWLWNVGVQRSQFVYAAAIALAGGALLWLLPRAGEVRIPRRSRLIVMRSVWLPPLAFLSAAALQSGVNTALAVVTFLHRGVANGAVIFTAIALSAAALRYPAGRFVERYGPRPMTIPMAILQVGGCVLAAFAYTPLMVIGAGILLGIAWSAVVPVGIALFFERSTRGTRGAAMGAYNLSFAIGTSAGALLAGILTSAGLSYGEAILACAVAPVAALPFVLRGIPVRVRVQKGETATAAKTRV